MTIFESQKVKMKKLSRFWPILFLFLFLTIGNTVSAQLAGGGPPGDPDGGGDPPCWPPPCIPIDGGLGVLLAAGAIFGGKKLYDASKETES